MKSIQQMYHDVPCSYSKQANLGGFRVPMGPHFQGPLSAKRASETKVPLWQSGFVLAGSLQRKSYGGTNIEKNNRCTTTFLWNVEKNIWAMLGTSCSIPKELVKCQKLRSTSAHGRIHDPHDLHQLHSLTPDLRVTLHEVASSCTPPPCRGCLQRFLSERRKKSSPGCREISPTIAVQRSTTLLSELYVLQFFWTISFAK